MFTGFSPEAIDFLWGIRLNNNREWFQAHKQQYQQSLYEPMKALSLELSAAFTQTEGLKMHLSRIYRDMRMHPPVPYKESLWMCLRRDGGSWLEHPCLFFELTAEGYSYGFLLWGPKAAAMERYREQLCDHTDEFLKITREIRRKTGLSVSGDRYARPKPCPDPRLEPYFSLKNLYAISEHPVQDALFAPSLAEQVRDTLLALLPLNEFCQNFAY